MSDAFFNKYRNKIITSQNLTRKIKRIRAKKKVAMCHGVFDVVHPGHVRHLAYVKSKADILIVSITSDKFINKGVYRPHVPQLIRASNLAAFEMVDYVIIDNNKEPLSNILKIKPNFYAKGFEYSKSNMTPETLKEMNILKKIGSKMIFTPGDVVYSSSKLIESLNPNIVFEKLYFLLKNNNLSFQKISKTIKSLKNFSIHVVGDTIIDKFTYTTLIGGQTKTPTLSLLRASEKKFLGGAGLVALNIRATGAKVFFTTILGKDENAKFAKEILLKNKIKLYSKSDSDRPTTEKNVIINQNHRILKIDTLENKLIDKSSIKYIKNKISKIKTNAVVFSDFRHGIFNRDSIAELTSAIPGKAIKVADSQVASRWGNIQDFKNFDLITPNEREARFALADQDSTVNALTEAIYSKNNYKNIILKLGSRGILSCDRSEMNPEKHLGFSLDSFAEHVIDPVGSGDALLAYATLSYLATNSLLIASIVGSIAAACSCEKDGNEPISLAEIESKLKIIEKKMNFKK